MGDGGRGDGDGGRGDGYHTWCNWYEVNNLIPGVWWLLYNQW